ncbi:hypothetical protein ABE10_01010, partial [Bacillus toyonensis]|nr:hypothetical protein [Bacillus toyonensis]
HALAEEALGDLVERAVVLRDDVGVGTHLEARHVDATGPQGLELAEEHLEVDHDAVADDRGDAWREDAGGEKMQGVLLVSHDDRVTGVVAAVELDDPVGPLAEQIG